MFQPLKGCWEYLCLEINFDVNNHRILFLWIDARFMNILMDWLDPLNYAGSCTLWNVFAFKEKSKLKTTHKFMDFSTHLIFHSACTANWGSSKLFLHSATGCTLEDCYSLLLDCFIVPCLEMLDWSDCYMTVDSFHEMTSVTVMNSSLCKLSSALLLLSCSVAVFKNISNICHKHDTSMRFLNKINYFWFSPNSSHLSRFLSQTVYQSMWTCWTLKTPTCLSTVMERLNMTNRRQLWWSYVVIFEKSVVSGSTDISGSKHKKCQNLIWKIF